MTRGRAIEVLKAWDLNWSDEFTAKEFEQAFIMAISALEKNESAENKEETEEMTNEKMLDKVLRNFFPRALFIREINEASHTKKIIFSDEWLKKPYKGGE